jgi:hypothetical protein
MFVRLFAKETPETRKLNDCLRERKASRLQAMTAEKANPETTMRDAK